MLWISLLGASQHSQQLSICSILEYLEYLKNNFWSLPSKIYWWLLFVFTSLPMKGQAWNVYFVAHDCRCLFLIWNIYLWLHYWHTTVLYLHTDHKNTLEIVSYYQTYNSTYPFEKGYRPKMSYIFLLCSTIIFLVLFYIIRPVWENMQTGNWDNFSTGRCCCAITYAIFHHQIPKSDRDALWAMITYYGGHCQSNLNPKCTHLVSGKASGVNADFLYL